MLFKKKSIRQSENEHLVEKILLIKHELDRFEDILDKSVEPSEDVLVEMKIRRAKYMFLIKEARYRGVNGFRNS